MSRGSSMTKDQLKNVLIQNGIPLPPGSAKKEEYQKLYNQNVLPNMSRSEFSSDDEPEMGMNGNRSNDTTDRKSQPRKSEDRDRTSATGKKYNEKELRKCTNEELFQACHDILGPGKAGPVVDSTRPIYINILVSKMNEVKANGAHEVKAKTETVTATATNGSGENGFSDTDDDEALETASRTSRSSRGSTTPKRVPTRPASAAVKKPSPKPAFTESEARPTPSASASRSGRRAEGPRVTSPGVDEGGSSGGLGLGRPRRRELWTAESSSTATEVSEVTEVSVEQGVSYFKERPGYASTTTSNVLRTKPIRKDHPKIVEAEFAEDRSWSALFLYYVGLICIIFVLLYAIYLLQGQYLCVENKEGMSEVDSLLESLALDDPNGLGM